VKKSAAYNKNKRGRPKKNEKEQAMRSHTNPKQRGQDSPPLRVGFCPSSTAQAAAHPTLSQAAPPGPDRTAEPRLSVPDRQRLLSSKTIDEILEADHPARAVWSYVVDLDLSVLYDRIRARGSVAGRPAIDPRLLVALWLYATLSGFTSARELADLSVHHDAFRWLAGGVSVNYHTLADFRTDTHEFLEQLLKQSVERLRQQGLVDLDRIAQDGMRVRASAGAASFRSRETLERLLQEALAEVQRLQQQQATSAAKDAGSQEVASKQGTAGLPEASAGQQAAELRHAEERLDRVDQALQRMPQMEEKIKPNGNKKARVSTTDAEATVMKMADGGYRPAYNVQFSTACEGQVITGVDVVRVGSDQGQMPPMINQIEKRFGKGPKEVLVDGGFANKQDIEKVQKEKNCTVYTPVAKPKKEGADRHEPKATDSAEVAAWRKRMGTEEAKEIYKARAATAECVNAQARNRGLKQFLVRGLKKVKAMAMWFAIAHNMARSFALQPQLAMSNGP
jgi:transposase